MTPDYVPTFIRWYNSAEGSKVASADVGSYENIPYGAQQGGEKHAAGKPPHPEHGQFQWGVACSRTSRTIMIDIDKPEHWKKSATFVELGEIAECVTSYREDGERFHIWVTVPAELLPLWPRQGPTEFGDVKSNGFSYHEGIHYTGMRYLASQNPVSEADEDLLRALTSDRTGADEGLATGAVSGRWTDDAYRITGDSQLTADIMSMVANGLSDEQVNERLTVILQPLTDPWTPAQIQGKTDSARRKTEAREQEEEAFWNGFFLRACGRTTEQEMERRRLRVIEDAERATPEGIQQDTKEWIEHRIFTGASLLSVPLADRLNPLRRPIEPRGSSDKNNAMDILEAGFSVFRLADDEGCWLRNAGTHWETWGTKSELQQKGRAIVSAFGTYLKTDAQLSEELSAQGTASSDEQIKMDDNRQEALVKSRGKYMNSQGQGTIATALATEASALDRYSVRIGDLDSEPDILWAGGYPWSLRHPELTRMSDIRPVNDVHMKTAACAPLTGPTPAFDQVLEAVWPDPEIRAWALREIAGVALWGSTSKSHPVLDGAPGGGKSTFALILVNVLGSYAVQVSPDKILGADTSSAHEEEVAAMIGARLVWMDEPPPGGKQSVSRFNDLASGTGKLAASRKYQNRISAPKLFNFLICQNPRNGLRMDAQGVGERMTFIPCNGEPEATRAAWERWKLEGQAEYPAILAWLIKECALFHLNQRLPVPANAILGRMDAQERADEFGTWLLDRYEILSADTPTVDSRLSASPTLGSLRTEYNDTCARPNRQPVVNAPEARDQLARLGIRVGTTGDKARRRKDTVFVSQKAYMGHY